MKICLRCRKNKDISNFYRNKSKPDGLSSYCKICFNKHQKIYKKTEKYKLNQKRYNKKYRQSDKYKNGEKAIKARLDGRIYRQKEENKNHARDYRKNKLLTDLQFKLSCRLRARLYKAIKNNYKIGSAVKDLGITIPDFKIYIEKQFTKGMNWNNWSQWGWHLDHRQPLSTFDLTNKEELLRAINYKNIQPLWAMDNLSKGSKQKPPIP